MISKHQLKGLYLVVDPSLPEVLPKLEQAIKGGVNILQIWDHWQHGQKKEEFIHRACDLAHESGVPVLIHETWEWLKHTPADGIHFDEIPENWDAIRKDINRPLISGLTCGNDLDKVRWANEQQFSYISFCAMFPSVSAGSCEIVRPETVLRAREITSMPIFVSGGINHQNLDQVLELGVDGVAVISGILKSRDPFKAANEYQRHLVGFENY